MDELLLPLFPLDIVLLPEEPLPLHIFEERYKEMIGECLEAKQAGKGEQHFGIVLLKDDVLKTAGCTARIVNVTRKYPDGRMDLFTVGVRRFEILYANRERSFLRGGVEYFEDDEGADIPAPADAQRAIELFRQILERLRGARDIPVHFTQPYRQLSFRIAGSLPLDVDFKQELLTLRNEPERLARTSRLLEKLIPEFDLIQRTRAKAGGNGHGRRQL